MKGKPFLIGVIFTAFTALSVELEAQTIYQYKGEDAQICFFNKQQAQYIPHIMRKYRLGRELHGSIWGELPAQAPFMYLTDWEDGGNGGVSTMPHTVIHIGMAPLDMTYFTTPSNERYDHLFKHEYTHVMTTDKANSTDTRWRNFTGNKVVVNSNYPMSALWSYLDVPRWYAPRWYQEGIACFLETWLSGGCGRALGGYDETYFRTRISDGDGLFSVVGLETEGSTSDFQQGATSYLYGTRFVNYLAMEYGWDKVVDFYNRTDGSKAFYAKQFEQVFGKRLRDAWDDWRFFEEKHQRENLETIAEYPLTETVSMTDENLGSASPMIIDEDGQVAYVATNHPDHFSAIARYRLDGNGRFTGKPEYLGTIDGSSLYQPAHIAYDKNGQRLFWTDRNGKVHGLVVYDLKKGKKAQHLKYQRIYEICYDNVNDCLYGLLTNQGVAYLIRYDSALENREFLYSFPFGVSVSDLDVSHDGKSLVVSLLGTTGEHSLIMFDTDEFDDGILSYRTLLTLKDANVSQFRFSADDSKLVGFSYYTGVPNIWSYDLESEAFELVSNVQTGMYAPYLASDGTVYAYKFSSEGMNPVSFKYQELKDANSVTYLGQLTLEKNPQISSLYKLSKPLDELSFGEVYDSVKIYNPLKELKFQGAYPDISGFTDRQAWNNVTPVVGYHLSFYDPLSLVSVNLMVGASPWSHNDWKNRFHAMADIKYYHWRLNAGWNPTNFYDLFGPRRSSRKGYNVSLSYDRSYTTQSPFTWEWGAGIAHYGGMDALPLYQEIAVDEGITSFQTASANIKAGKVRTSLGGITPEKGWRVSGSAYTYLAGGKFFPSVDITGDLGTPLPFGRHNAFWLKGALGQAFGDSKSALGNNYFGGFRNNYVDNGDINRYATASAMPGARIDQISAHNYAKATGEINFCPIRFNNFGALQCYPNYIQFCVFGHDLLTNAWGADKASMANYVSAGAQMNIQMVFFTYMKTTLSIGYARVWAWGDPNLNRQGELMISLKLL